MGWDALPIGGENLLAETDQGLIVSAASGLTVQSDSTLTGSGLSNDILGVTTPLNANNLYTLAKVMMLASGNVDRAVDDAARTLTFGVTPFGGVSLQSADYTIVAGDREKTIAYNGTAAATFTLPDITGDVAVGFEVRIANLSDSTLTVDGNGTDTVGGSATYVLESEEAVALQISTATEWIVVGVGGDFEDQIVRSTSAPSDTSRLWVDTDNNILKYYDGTSWEGL